MNIADPEYRSSLPSLVEFSCNCIGFAPDRETGMSLLVWRCDTNDSLPIGIGLRDMRGKEFKPADPMRVASIFCELSKLVSDGESYRELSLRMKAMLCD